MQQVVGRVRAVKYDIQRQKFSVRKAFSVIVLVTVAFIFISLRKVSSPGERNKFIQITNYLKSTENSSVQLIARVEEEQGRRQQHLKRFCRKRTQEGAQYSDYWRSLHFIRKQVTYNDRGKIIYCSVPKVASTNWKRVIHTLRGRFKDPLENDGGKIHEWLPFFAKLSRSQTLKRKQHYLSFMFTRHPFERVVSAYRNKFVAPGNDTYIQRKYGSLILRRFRKGLTAEQYAAGQIVTFLEFLRYIVQEYKENRIVYLNPHWKPAVLLCHPCTMNYTFLGKMETMFEDSHYVMQHIGRESGMDLRLPARRRYNKKSESIAQHLFANVSKEIMRDLYKVYEQDFEVFDYTAKGYL